MLPAIQSPEGETGDELNAGLVPDSRWGLRRQKQLAARS